MTKQTHGDKTREKILNAGVELWPYISVSSVARKAGLTHAAVLYHFPTCNLKNKIAEHAITIGDSRVIVQLIASRHPAIGKMPVGERHSHFRSV
jgi:AcrR family transcriptional regulator